MPTFNEHIGGLIEKIKGGRYTRIYTDVSRSEVHHLQSDKLEDDFYVTITSRRVVYLTTYRRWWIFNRRTTVYEVSCVASPEAQKVDLDPRYFDKVVYPLLCTRLLQWSLYPHMLAINAFLGRIPDCREVPPNKIDV